MDEKHKKMINEVAEVISATHRADENRRKANQGAKDQIEVEHQHLMARIDKMAIDAVKVYYAALSKKGLESRFRLEIPEYGEASIEIHRFNALAAIHGRYSVASIVHLEAPEADRGIGPTKFLDLGRVRRAIPGWGIIRIDPDKTGTKVKEIPFGSIWACYDSDTRELRALPKTGLYGKPCIAAVTLQDTDEAIEEYITYTLGELLKGL